jgi:hypothetical protein
MRWLYVAALMLPASLSYDCRSCGAIHGFVESFSGDGPYDGFDNPDWFITGDSMMQDGGLRFVNRHSFDEFGRKLSGRGSFAAAIEFRDLFLGDLDQFASEDAAGIVDLIYDFTPNDDTGDAIGVVISESNGDPPNQWTLGVLASGMESVVGIKVPQANMSPVRLELIYDDVLNEFTVTYDNDTSDAAAAVEIGPFPFARNIDETEQHVNLLVSACCAFTLQSGLLDYFAVEPFSDIEGDFNGNGVLDAADIDQLSAQVRAATNDPLFDLNTDSLVDDLDRHAWVRDLKQTYFGDADLNGSFDSTDLVQVLGSGEYEDGFDLNSTWLTGDWEGDGDFTSGDLVLALADGGYEAGAAAVPEPNGIILAMGAAAIAAFRHRRSKTRRKPTRFRGAVGIDKTRAMGLGMR